MNDKVEEIFEQAKKNDNKNKYVEYFHRIQAHTSQDVFWRFVFAYLSIHSTYKSNVIGYLTLKDPYYWKSEEHLKEGLVKARCGMQNNRARYLWNFRNEYFNGMFHSLNFVKGLQERRNNIARRLEGIGMAKVSFALEMSFPMQTSVVCLDVHHLRLYGEGEKVSVSRYMEIEDDWCARSAELGLPPFIVRNIFWDKTKEQPSPRFWSFVFEPRGDLLSVEDAHELSFDDDLNALTMKHTAL